MQGQVRIYFYAISAVVIWSTLAAMAKSLLTVIPTFEALFLSSLIASVFLLVQQGVRGGLRVFRAYDGRGCLAMAGLGFVGLFVYSGLYFYGLTQLTSQEACILNYLWPMMIVLFAALLLGERITLRTAVALLLSFSGVLVLTLGGEGRADGNAVLGALACVLAALCYGLFCVLNRKRNVDPTVLMTVAWGVTALCALPVTLMAETWVTLSWTQWGGCSGSASSSTPLATSGGRWHCSRRRMRRWSRTSPTSYRSSRSSSPPLHLVRRCPAPRSSRSCSSWAGSCCRTCDEGRCVEKQKESCSRSA